MQDNWMSFWKGNGKWFGLIIFFGLLPFLSILFSHEILFASDQLGSASWSVYFDAWRHGDIPFWNPYHLGGMPIFDASPADGSYPFFILLGILLSPEKVVQYGFILHVLIAGCAAFLLVRKIFNLSGLLSFALALAYMLNTNFISHIHAGHTGKFHIMAWLPLSLFFLIRSLQKEGKWFHLLGLSLTITLFILTSHLQFTYYVLMGYFLFWCFKIGISFKEKDYGRSFTLVLKFWIPILLGVGLAFPLFYPPTQYNKLFSVRGQGERTTYEHATSWSMHPEEVASLIVPEFSGFDVKGEKKYWGQNPFKLNSEYPGLAVLFLGAFGLFAFRSRWFYFWAGLGLLSIIFGLGAHTFFFRLFYDFIPGIKNFRAPSMILFWLAIALLMMSAQTLSLLEKTLLDMSEAKKQQWTKKLFQFGFGFSGLLILGGLSASATYGLWNSTLGSTNFPNINAQPSNYSDFSVGTIKNGVLLAILVFALGKWVLQGSNWNKFGLVLAAIVLVDLYLVDNKFIYGIDFNRIFPKEQAVEYLKTDTSSFRVFGVPGAYDRGYMQYNKIQTADDWADNEYTIYRAYRGNDYQQNPNFFFGLQQNPDGTVGGSKFLDMLNVKYIAFRTQNDPGIKLALNKTVLPRAYFVHQWENADDNVILEKMKTPEFDPKRKVLVSSTTPTPFSGADSDSTSAIIKRNYEGFSRLDYNVKNTSSGLLVLSEIYFPFWQVTVNGKPVTLLRVNYAFRGVLLPAGENHVEMHYVSPWIHKSFYISLAALLGLGIFLFFSRYLPKGKAILAVSKP